MIERNQVNPEGSSPVQSKYIPKPQPTNYSKTPSSKMNTSTMNHSRITSSHMIEPCHKPGELISARTSFIRPEDRSMNTSMVSNFHER